MDCTNSYITDIYRSWLTTHSVNGFNSGEEIFVIHDGSGNPSPIKIGMIGTTSAGLYVQNQVVITDSQGATALVLNGNTQFGFQGYQGFQGNTGVTGNSGVQGFQGSNGSGTQGFQGIAGSTGFNGAQGFQGNPGNNGTQGFQGSRGFQGNQGNAGSNGNTGANGAQGFQGVSGLQGPQGPTPNSVDTVLSPGDANFTVDVFRSYLELPNITAPRTLTLPQPGIAGGVIKVINTNTTQFQWMFAGMVKDVSNNVISIIVNNSVYILEFNGSFYRKIN